MLTGNVCSRTSNGCRTRPGILAVAQLLHRGAGWRTVEVGRTQRPEEAHRMWEWHRPRTGTRHGIDHLVHNVETGRFERSLTCGSRPYSWTGRSIPPAGRCTRTRLRRVTG